MYTSDDKPPVVNSAIWLLPGVSLMLSGRHKQGD